MPIITVLPPHVANQIAAGEVVERPASVVKELVENALDANAAAVSIEIEDGGVKLIRVTDNGCGIASADSRTAFLRHATSKIKSTDDLVGIRSLGFRGEALPSIASVASVTLRTRRSDEELGTQLLVERGEVRDEAPIGWQQGTSMEVRDLFFDTPARRKFLKIARTEAGYVSDYVARLMLARPDVAFRFINNQNTVYETFGDGDLMHAIFAVYGAETAKQLCKVDYDDGYVRIQGYIGSPQLTRPNRSQQSFFLNGRYIRSAALSFALQYAYETRLMSGRFPFCALMLTLAGAEVDVNVHPAKLEVRFADEKRVSRAVSVACSRALIESAGVQPVRLSSSAHAALTEASPLKDRSHGFVDLRAGAGPVQRMRLAESGEPRIARDVGKDGGVPRYSIPARNHPAFSQDPMRTEHSEPRLFDAPIELVGALFETYWIAQQGSDAYLIDQHAAHERRLYERLMQREIAIESQRLLLPRRLELTPVDYDTYLRFESAFSELGYEIKQAGEGALTFLGVPIVNGCELPDRCFYEALEQLEQVGKASAHSLCRDALIQTACKHAVKAGERLAPAEVEALLCEYREKGAPLTCPHGRPVMVRVTKTELEKLFKRIV